MNGKVYFVKGHNSIKIGFTRDFEKRINSLNTSSPVNLSLLCLVDGDRAIEKALHEKFKPFQINREWFKDVPEIHDEIERLKSGIFPEVTNSRLWNADISGAIINKDVPYIAVNGKYPLSEAIQSDPDLLKTYILCEYLLQDSNIIGKDGEPFSISEIAEILDISEKRTKEYLSRMSKLRIMVKVKSDKLTYFLFNPLYVNACRSIPKSLCDLFGVSVD